MNKVVAADHPDCAGGIVWSACELRWINAKLEQQAERIKGMEAKLASFARGVKIQVPTDTMEQEFATHYRRGFDAGKTAANALIEQAREALWKLKDYAKGSNDCQYGTLSASLVARIADEAMKEEGE